VKKDGKKSQGRLSTVSEKQLELDGPSGKLKIAKAEIAEVYYLRVKPLTDSEKYSAQEDFFYDPRLWPYYLHLVPRLPVRLYDSLLPEDNAPVKCENNSNENTVAQSCFVGYVQTIDAPDLTLRRHGEDPKTIRLSMEAYVEKRGNQLSVDQIRVGDQIVVCGSVESSGFVARRVTVYK